MNYFSTGDEWLDAFAASAKLFNADKNLPAWLSSLGGFDTCMLRLALAATPSLTSTLPRLSRQILNLTSLKSSEL